MANRRNYVPEAGDMFGCNLTHKPLLESLHEPAIAEIEAAWGLEIERRLAEYDRGETYSIDGDEVFAKARSIAR
jgi:hypothetical protein